jgi:hypothetical protein
MVSSKKQIQIVLAIVKNIHRFLLVSIVIIDVSQTISTKAMMLSQ